MNPKEIVKRALEFDSPPRMPVFMTALGMTDLTQLWAEPNNDENDKWGCSWNNEHDQWGCYWERTEMENMGQVTGHPLASWDDYASYRFPDPDDPRRWELFRKRLSRVDDSLYVRAGIFMLLWERMYTLRGMENAMMDFYTDRDRAEELADRILEHQIRVAENLFREAKGRVDGVLFTEDWGTQNALMISPELWREFFKPRYAKFFSAVHDLGGHVWMHSCGKVTEIIGDLAEVGLDAMNLQQPRVLGIEDVGKRYAGKICFETLCDIQTTLPYGTPDEIRDEASLILNRWSTPKGGFVLCDYGDGAAIGVPKDRKQIMLDAFLAADRWATA